MLPLLHGVRHLEIMLLADHVGDPRDRNDFTGIQLRGIQVRVGLFQNGMRDVVPVAYRGESVARLHLVLSEHSLFRLLFSHEREEERGEEEEREQEPVREERVGKWTEKGTAESSSEAGAGEKTTLHFQYLHIE